MSEKTPIVKIENLSVNFPVKNALPFMGKKYIQAVTDVDRKSVV